MSSLIQLLSFLLPIFFLMGCSVNGTIEVQSSLGLSLSGINTTTEYIRNQTFNWGCTDELGCSYRYALSQNSSFVFSNEPYQNVNQLVVDNSYTDGKYFLFLQAKSSENKESSVLKKEINLDNTAPSAVVSTLPNSGVVNNGNLTNYTISGTCSDNGQVLTFSGSASAVATCNSGNFTHSFDFSSLSNGSISLSLNYSDLAGNSMTTQAINLSKSASTVVGVVVINSGDTNTNNLNSTISITSAVAAEMYITNSSGCTSGGVWESFSTTKAWTLPNSNSSNTIYVKLKDSSGNESGCLSDTIIHDNVSPSIAVTSPTAGSYVNILNQSTFTISGTCSENGQSVTVNAGTESGTTSCSGNIFSKSFDLSSLSEGGITVSASQIDLANNSGSSTNISILKDSIRPTLSLSALPNSGIVNLSNQNSYTLSGSCSENSQSISISGALSSTVSCSSGSFSKSLDLSSLSDGTISLNLGFQDAAGNSLVSSVNASLTKNTSPFSGSIEVNSSAAYTNSLSTTLTLNSAAATEMYITNISGCNSGGTWESYSTSKSWNLANANGTNTVYVKFKNAFGNESSCLNDSIIHDNITPSIAVTSPSVGDYVNTLNQSAFTISGTCSENGQSVTVNAGAVSGTTSCGGNVFSKSFDLSSLSDGLITISASQSDLAANLGSSSSFDVNKDTNNAAVVASLSGQPSGLNNSLVLNVTIGGSNIVAYQYKLGLSAATNCSIYSGYSSDVAVGTKITDNISALVDGSVTLCVIGKNSSGNYQMATSASTATWTKDSVANAPTGLTLITPSSSPNTNSSITIEVSGMEQNATAYLYSDNTCSNQVGTGTTGAGVFASNISVTGLSVGSYNFYAKQVDSAGNESVCSTTTIGYQMDTAAIVTSVNSSNGSLVATYYKAASNIPITVNFNKNVTVTGSPRLKLNSGANVYALYSSGSGTSELTFNYTVQAGENSSRLDYSSSTALELNGGSIVNNNIPANLTLVSPGSTNSLANLKNLFIDTTLPTDVSSLVDGSYMNSTTNSPTITFVAGADSESGLDRHQIQVVLGSNTSTVISSWADFTSGSSLSWLALTDGIQYKVQIKVIDKAGNETIQTSDGWIVDVSGPTAPSGLVLGSVPVGSTITPTLTWSAAADTGSGIGYYEAQIYQQGNGTPVKTWTNLASGAQLNSGFTLTHGLQYYFELRAVDQLGNLSSVVQSGLWTANSEVDCISTIQSPGTLCTGGVLYAGSLSPGATSGSGTDYYQTTPGGCGEIPAGQIAGGSGVSAYSLTDFTPTCSGMDALLKTWNDGSTNYYDVPGMANDGSMTISDVNYGNTNTTIITGITSGPQGGYHAAARYCDQLSYGGYTDWYLPNRAELNLLFTNKASISGFNISGSCNYWSSSEYSNTAGAWAQRCSDSVQYAGTKSGSGLVRCVRRIDKTPDAFSFSSVASATLNQDQESNAVTVSNFVGSIVYTTSGASGTPQIAKSTDGGSTWSSWASSQTVVSGNQIKLKVSVGATEGQVYTTTVTPNFGSAQNWSVTAFVSIPSTATTFTPYYGTPVSIIPQLTWDNSSGYLVSYSSLWSNAPYWQGYFAFSSNNNVNLSAGNHGGWLPSTTGTQWLKVQFPSSKNFSEVYLKLYRPGFSSWSTYRDDIGIPKNFKFQISNDGTNWTDVVSVTNFSYSDITYGNTAYAKFVFASTSATYFRLYITDLWRGTSGWDMGAIHTIILK